MGQEAACNVQFDGKRVKGKALLETSEILFRGRGELRLKIPFARIRTLRAGVGKLHVGTPDGPAVFELGPAAEKWLEKIRNPKSRLDKLGIKQDAAVCLVGAFAPDFLQEVRARTAEVSDGKSAANTNWIFFAAESGKDLSRVAALAKAMKDAAALWIVYPKGQKHITENNVLAAGRKAGLKDVKVVGFSPTHTALKFVAPLSER